MSSSAQTTIDLFRHGETVSGTCYLGTTDSKLSAQGWQQMHASVDPVAQLPWDSIISSPLIRCKAYAEKISSDNKIPLFIEQNIQEIAFGDFDGKNAEQLLLDYPNQIQQFWLDPINNTPPNGEHYLEFKNRILLAWQSILVKFNNRHVCIVTHAGVIRTIVQKVLEMPDNNLFRLEITHGSITRIELNGIAPEAIPRLLFLNSKL